MSRIAENVLTPSIAQNTRVASRGQLHVVAGFGPLAAADTAMPNRCGSEPHNPALFLTIQGPINERDVTQ
jgi:hypothetical protein